MSMIPMPGCLETRLSSLTAAERASVVRWLEYGRCAEDEMKEVLASEAGVVQTMHNGRAQKLFLQQQEQFRWAARDNVIIAKCVNIAEQEGMPPEFAWLAACMALLEQNKALMSTAHARVGESYTFASAVAPPPPPPPLARIPTMSGLLSEMLKDAANMELNTTPGGANHTVLMLLATRLRQSYEVVMDLAGYEPNPDDVSDDGLTQGARKRRLYDLPTLR